MVFFHGLWNQSTSWGENMQLPINFDGIPSEISNYRYEKLRHANQNKNMHDIHEFHLVLNHASTEGQAWPKAMIFQG